VESGFLVFPSLYLDLIISCLDQSILSDIYSAFDNNMRCVTCATYVQLVKPI